jgi:hypothetical protein
VNMGTNKQSPQKTEFCDLLSVLLCSQGFYSMEFSCSSYKSITSFNRVPTFVFLHALFILLLLVISVPLFQATKH